jgi:hypothetical protein
MVLRPCLMASSRRVLLPKSSLKPLPMAAVAGVVNLIAAALVAVSGWVVYE